MGLDRVAEFSLSKNALAILSSDFFSLQAAGHFQVGDDRLHGPFGDPHSLCDFTQHHLPIARQQDHHMGMIGEERLAGGLSFGRFGRRYRRSLSGFRSGGGGDGAASRHLARQSVRFSTDIPGSRTWSPMDG